MHARPSLGPVSALLDVYQQALLFHGICAVSRLGIPDRDPGGHRPGPPRPDRRVARRQQTADPPPTTTTSSRKAPPTYALRERLVPRGFGGGSPSDESPGQRVRPRGVR